MDALPRRNIVIIGGGVIGCTTAYFLTRHPAFNPALHRITLLEATSIAAGASGKAGGLLALWAYPDCLVPLSFRLHRELADEHGGADRWGYRRLGCGSLGAVVQMADLEPPKPEAPNGASDALPIQSSTLDSPVQNGEDKDWEKLPKQDEKAAGLLKESPLPADLDWVNGELIEFYEEMGKPGFTDTAQVHPYFFTNALAELAREKGVDIRIGAKVTKINHSKAGGVQSIEYEDRETSQSHTMGDVTDVVVTAGPWTGRLLPRTRVEGLRAHSVVFEADVSPYAIFTDIQLPNDYVPEHRARLGQKRKHRGNVDPEIYARPKNEVYACGEPDSTIPLPETADLVQCDEAQCDDLIAYIGTVSPVLGAAPIKAKQACYLPRHMRFGEERGPLIGQTGVRGIWVAAGHTCWGIQNGPATGYLMAELLLEGKAKSANIDKLDPKKFKV
ncbi:putative oxidoreductase TDA3 [Echria macrotheca]|uniref:Oxidoreductase TDA3 n=1 Tax=Echria macrotheca TaxID=438768 RepID=A0AAJ0BLV2_9PEZI|nr:putative oxidoreductase TDA3 [Echria macrotheca]